MKKLIKTRSVIYSAVSYCTKSSLWYIKSTINSSKAMIKLLIAKIKNIKKTLPYNIYYIFSGKKLYYLIGTPAHSNIGDAAISYAEKLFLKKNKINIKEVPLCNYKQIKKKITKQLKKSKDSQIYLQGGGNMGSLWPNEELFRREVLLDFQNYKKIIFPQTFWYSDDATGISEKNKSIRFYNDNKLKIFARDKVSLLLMKNLYPKANILLCPDIVLTTCKKDYKLPSFKRSYIMFCFRKDKEKDISDKFLGILENYFIQNKQDIVFSDMLHKENIMPNKSYKIIKNKMEEFSKAKLVLTDRLHAMIFAAITETPCLVFSNGYHKVKATYEWLKHLDYIEYANTTQEALYKSKYLLSLKNCRFENKKILKYFDKILS